MTPFTLTKSAGGGKEKMPAWLLFEAIVLVIVKLNVESGFPVLAKQNGAQLVILNREPTDQDEIADLVLHDEIGPVMSSVVPAN